MFIITTHARERYVERFSREKKKFLHLKNCRESCNECRELTYELQDLINSRIEMWDNIIRAKLYDAKDVKVFNNDSVFMENLYNKFGFDRYRFLVESDIVFIICVQNGKNIVKTCMGVDCKINGSRVISNLMKRPKYKKKPVA